jgi:hypothetical protein
VPLPLPAPRLFKTGNVAPVSGKVFVRLAGTSTFVELTSPEQIPFGSELDTTAGRARVTTATGKPKKTQTADFYQGRFVLTQPKAKVPVTVLVLSGPLGCSKKHFAASDKKKKRRLWGSGKGKFRTRGKNATASVRGTIWLTQDTCTTTLVHVKRGIVDVFDFAKNKHVFVKAGHTYIARAHK